MWFRVELNTDGTIASCAQVATSFENGKTVRYVEADSPERAVDLVRRWRRSLDLARARANRYKQEAMSAGICVSCKHAPAVQGRVCCEVCAALQRHNSLTRKNGTRTPNKRNSPEESLRLYEARVARGLEKQRLRLGNSYEYAKKVARREILKEIIARFDSCNAVVFRSWLESELAAAISARPPKKALPWKARAAERDAAEGGKSVAAE